MEVVSRPQYDGADPFKEVDESLELEELINRTLPTEQQCSALEYVQSEDGLPVSVDYDGENWDDIFLSELSDEKNDTAEEVRWKNNQCPGYKNLVKP